jgi:hypothetical protein
LALGPGHDLFLELLLERGQLGKGRIGIDAIPLVVAPGREMRLVLAASAPIAAALAAWFAGPVPIATAL